MSIHNVLVQMFGAEPDDINVSSLDHLCIVLTRDKVVMLLEAMGGKWKQVLERIEVKQNQMKNSKDPGEDARMKEDKR